MERIIRFRGKRLDYNEWVYGDLTTKNISPRFSGDHCIFDGSWHVIDPCTVGQFIGRKDRYGKEIYEGDILDFYDEECGKPENLCGARLEVKWNKEESRFGYQNHGEGHEYISGFKRLWNEDTYVIIGNIYDNPELLDVEND